MFISQLTSTSGFGELHFGEKLLTAVGATKEGGHSFLHDGTNWDTFHTYRVCVLCNDVIYFTATRRDIYCRIRIFVHDGEKFSVGEDHTKRLSGPDCGPRAACCTPLA